jgi:hypothetical protein
MTWLLPVNKVRDVRLTLLTRVYPTFRALKHLILDAHLGHFYLRVDNTPKFWNNLRIEKREPEVIQA